MPIPPIILDLIEAPPPGPTCTTVSISVDITGLAPGTYTGFMNFSSACNNPPVAITLIITAFKKNVVYDFNLNQQCWHLPGILQMPQCSALGSIETSPGVWRMLVCSTGNGTSQLAYRDINNFLDLGNAYSPVAVFGSIQVADPGTLAKFGARGGMVLEFTNAGTLPTLAVLPNDMGCDMSQVPGSQVIGNFVNLSVPKNGINWPPTLGAQPVNYRSKGFYWLMGKALSAFVRHFQFKVTAPAENEATEMIGFGIFGDEKQESEAPGQVPQLQGR